MAVIVECRIHARRIYKQRQLQFNMSFWTALICGVGIVVGERPEMRQVPSIVPFNSKGTYFGGTESQRLQLLKTIEDRDYGERQTVGDREVVGARFEAERKKANAEISNLKKDSFDKAGREYTLAAENWDFRRARDSHVTDEDLRKVAANPPAHLKRNWQGPWFAAARAQKQELEYGVERLKDASKFMSWQSEEAYRRIHNLEKMVTGFEAGDRDGSGQDRKARQGMAHALAVTDEYVDRIAGKRGDPGNISREVKKIGNLANSYLDIAVFGDEMDSDQNVNIPVMQPRDEVTLEDTNQYKVRFYRQSVNGRCEIHRDVTQPVSSATGHGQLSEGVCGQVPGTPQKKKIEKLIFESEDWATIAKITDDCGGEHELAIGDERDSNTEATLMSLIAMVRACGVDTEGDPTLFSSLLDDAGTLRQKVKAVTPHKYYSYLLQNGPKREELDHRLDLPVEISGVPDY
jgi:hypothetical protein